MAGVHTYRGSTGQGETDKEQQRQAMVTSASEQRTKTVHRTEKDNTRRMSAHLIRLSLVVVVWRGGGLI